jgi:hypothetical protein
MAPFPWHLSTLLVNLGNLKVIMIVLSAPRIELCPASRAARITLQVLKNSHRSTAGAAKYGWLVPFTFRPDCDGMIGERHVAVSAGIVKAATFHLDGDDVIRPVIMLATGL